MAEQTCDCCEPSVGAPTDRWLEERPVTSAPLPPDVSRTMNLFFDEPIETFEDFAGAIRGELDEESLHVADLCHTAAETPHRGIVGDAMYPFECFFDGVVLAYLVDEPVEVRTESPAGAPIELVVAPDGGIATTPPAAVMSFGISPEPSRRVDRSSVDEAVTSAVCPYVRAFRSREHYESWAAGVPAATVGMPLEAGVGVAACLTGEI